MMHTTRSRTRPRRDVFRWLLPLSVALGLLLIPPAFGAARAKTFGTLTVKKDGKAAGSTKGRARINPSYITTEATYWDRRPRDGHSVYAGVKILHLDTTMVGADEGPVRWTDFGKSTRWKNAPAASTRRIRQRFVVKYGSGESGMRSELRVCTDDRFPDLGGDTCESGIATFPLG